MKNYILIGIVAVIVYMLYKSKQAKDILSSIAGNTQSVLFAANSNTQSSYVLPNPVAGSGGTVIANSGTSLSDQSIDFAADQQDGESSFQL